MPWKYSRNPKWFDSNKYNICFGKNKSLLRCDSLLLSICKWTCDCQSKENMRLMIIYRFCTFQDDTNLYMLLEYVVGGELFSHLRRAGRFTNDMTRFYASEIVLAIEYLHSKNIIYRDLKPENLLIDHQGHIRITDFGFAKKITDRYVQKGDNWMGVCDGRILRCSIFIEHGHYVVHPNILHQKSFKAKVTAKQLTGGHWVSWFSKCWQGKRRRDKDGLDETKKLIQHLPRYPPFFDDNSFGIYEKILAGRVQFPAHFDALAKDLLKRLLVGDLTKRLGNLKVSWEHVVKVTRI